MALRVKQSFIVPTGAILIFTGVFGVLAWKNYTLEAPYDRAYKAVEAARSRGDITSAIGLLAPLAASTSTAPRYIRMEALLALPESLFATGTKSDEARAIEMLKTFIADASTPPPEKSLGMDALFNLYYIDRSPATFAMIFNGPPLGDLLKPGMRQKDALRSAFILEWNIYPTALDALHLANWYAGELLDDQSLDATQRTAYVSALQTLLEKGERMHRSESPFGSNNTTLTQYEVIYQNLDAFLVAVLATEHVEYSPSFEDRYASLENAIVRQKDGGAALQSLLPYVLLYHGAFLDLVYGSGRQKDEVRLADELAGLLGANSDTNLYFGRFVAIEAESPPVKRDHDYRFFAALAAESPALKSALLQYGFTL
ncbi:MAG: hypothetical protein KGI71_02470 [Patescibacteria group bacterium]|nr:hypothetical protein [Patescibacteria group bacterium]